MFVLTQAGVLAQFSVKVTRSMVMFATSPSPSPSNILPLNFTIRLGYGLLRGRSFGSVGRLRYIRIYNITAGIVRMNQQQWNDL